jgi:hypothetical protein
VREGDWKLIGNALDTSGGKLDADDKKLFLANLVQDLSETRNLAKENPGVVQHLLKLHEEWVSAQKGTAFARLSRDSKGDEQ